MSSRTKEDTGVLRPGDPFYEVRKARLLAHGTRIPVMSFPTEETHPGFDKLKRLAARVGRTFYEAEKHAKAKVKLYEYMQTLPIGQMFYYEQLTMLVNVPPHAGATGQGAFWAVASHIVNETAFRIMQEHRDEWRAKYGDAKFVVEE